jgi:hypothetical protein
MHIVTPARLAGALGFQAAQYGDAFALGVPNGRGGLTAYQLGPMRASDLAQRLRECGVRAVMRPGGNPGKHIVTFYS